MTDTLRKTTRGKNRWVSIVNPMHDKIGEASVTYQLEFVKCGKARCNKWHGPYWYAYWSAGGKTRTLYVGKTLRSAAEVANERNARKRKAARIRKADPRPAKQRRGSYAAELPRLRMKQEQLPHTDGHPFPSPFVGGLQ